MIRAWMTMGMLLTALAGCRAAGGGAAAERAPQPALFTIEDPAASTRLASIRRELAGLDDHAWAGVYHRGDPAGAVGDDLILAPQSGYVLQLRGRTGVCRSGCPNCAAGRASVASGAIVPGPRDSLKLAMELSPGEVILVEELVPAQRGRQHYLVPVNELDAFQSAVQAGTEPRAELKDRLYLREADPLHPPPAGAPPR
ncbi:MAG: hypothetical protein C4547_06225 [Phycisphaerales bacterium]|nr:MAG: hypothetical protein C4547_06225 [Phycisphaerales bacterium]